MKQEQLDKWIDIEERENCEFWECVNCGKGIICLHDKRKHRIVEESVRKQKIRKGVRKLDVIIRSKDTGYCWICPVCNKKFRILCCEYEDLQITMHKLEPIFS